MEKNESPDADVPNPLTRAAAMDRCYIGQMVHFYTLETSRQRPEINSGPYAAIIIGITRDVVGGGAVGVTLRVMAHGTTWDATNVVWDDGGSLDIERWFTFI